MMSTAQMEAPEPPGQPVLYDSQPRDPPQLSLNEAFDPHPPERFGRMVSASLLSLTGPGGSSLKTPGPDSTVDTLADTDMSL